jgi:CheY-like chemotaxis protein
MNFIGRLFATGSQRIKPVTAVTAAQLSLDSILELLKNSRSSSETEYAGLLLREYVATQAQPERAAKAQSRQSRAADQQDEALDLLRSARTPFEAEVAADALLTSMRPSAAPSSEELREYVAIAEDQIVPRSEKLRTVSVLVVEDDANYRQLLVATLHRNGANVTEAGSVDEAMKLIAHNSPDVVVSDIELPRASGYDLMERINREDPRIPVLAISGHAQDMSALRDAGFRFFFSKEPGVLRDIVNTIARMPAVVGSPALPITPKSGRKPTARR